MHKRDLRKLSEHFGKRVYWVTAIDGVMHVYFDKKWYLSNRTTMSMEDFEGVMG